MPNELDPLQDQWYTYTDKGQPFYVVDIDEADTVEVQHFDGDLEMFSLEEWRQLDIQLSEQPENWEGPLDVGEIDDLGTEVTDTVEDDWREPAEDYRTSAEEKLFPDPEADINEPADDYKDPLITAAAEAASSTLNRRLDGNYEESLGNNWIAKYAENTESGLWDVEVFKHDVSEWQATGYASLDDAREAAEEYYEQV